MRRFLIRNAAGEQVGEGVEWPDRQCTAFVYSHHQQHALHGFGGVTALFDGRVTLEWIDPDTTSRGPNHTVADIDGGGPGGTGTASFRLQRIERRIEFVKKP
jgi:hypothetical protein